MPEIIYEFISSLMPSMVFENELYNFIIYIITYFGCFGMLGMILRFIFNILKGTARPRNIL